MEQEGLNRRDFVRITGLSTAAVAIGRTLSASAAPEIRAINLAKETGSYYEATVPDTLDLAERARLGVNHFTSVISEKDNYEMYWRADFDKPDQWSWPGHMWFAFAPLFCVQQKAMMALAMQRLMTGSVQNLEREAKMLEMMVSLLGDDGLQYIPPTGGRKPWLGPEELRPYAHTHGQGRMLYAMIGWYQYTGDPAWKERIDRMVNGLDQFMVVHKDDYAYIPTHGWMTHEYLRSCYVKSRGWKDTAEPIDEKSGEEGSLFNHQGHIPGALALWYRLSGNEQALRLSGQLVRFLTKPKFWADWKDGEYPGVVGAEHAHWQGHFHGHINTLRAILQYAVEVDDPELKLFVRDGYEWARQAGVTRIGVVGDGQGCGLGRMIGLAIQLTDAGVGDYWEDVDLYIRNHGTEMQFTPDDVPHLQELLAKNPNPTRPPELIADHPTGTDVDVINASMGGFSMQYLPFKNGWIMCCSPWGNMGIFSAWEGTLRYVDGVARVNLLLNRASPWMDIDSHLPYEGKVVLRNKTAREAEVRIPLWVNRVNNKKAVRCRIGDLTVRPKWSGNYLRVESLKAGDVVTIEFPMSERIERWTAPPHNAPYVLPLAPGTKFTCKFKGNTVVELSPPLSGDSWLYQNRPGKYKVAKAPMRKVTRYVTPTLLDWRA
jgi:hypothetical protein